MSRKIFKNNSSSGKMFTVNTKGVSDSRWTSSPKINLNQSDFPKNKEFQNKDQSKNEEKVKRPFLKKTTSQTTVDKNSSLAWKVFFGVSFLGMSFLAGLGCLLAFGWVFGNKIWQLSLWAGYSASFFLVIWLCISFLYFAGRITLRFWRRKKKVTSGLVGILFFIILLLFPGVVAFAVFHYEASKPEYKQLILQCKKILSEKETHVKIEFRDGSLLWFENERIVGPVEVMQSPVYLAIVGIEDERFFTRSEGAIDFRSTVRASIKYSLYRLGLRKDKEGGSTIPMQIAKILLGKSKNVEFAGKIQDAILAQRIDDELSKEEQLALYINLVEIDGKLRGMAAAAYDYFGVNELSGLKLEQAALLAALLKGQTKFNPRNPKTYQATSDRRDIVLNKMLELGFISKEECEKAKQTKLEVLSKGWNSQPFLLKNLKEAQN